MTRVLVLGAGVSGRSAARLATSHGMTATIFDEKVPDDLMDLGLGVATGGWDPLLLHGVDLVVASPEIGRAHV